MDDFRYGEPHAIHWTVAACCVLRAACRLAVLQHAARL